MKSNVAILALAGFILAPSLVQAQTPGSITAVAGQVTGTVSVATATLSGCPTRVCTTNFVTRVECFTNTFQRIVCTTNASSGAVTCTNVPVTEMRCFTNTFPEISCTNELLTPPTTMRVEEALFGPLTAGACNELAALFPSNAMFEASIALNVRTNDWIGTQIGAFKITVGTNILAIGSLTGVNGLSTPVPDDGSCAVCNGFQGTLHGTVLLGGPLHGTQIQAAYRGVLTGVTCPSPSVPQGPVDFVFDGVSVEPCPAAITPFSGF